MGQGDFSYGEITYCGGVMRRNFLSVFLLAAVLLGSVWAQARDVVGKGLFFVPENIARIIPGGMDRLPLGPNVLFSLGGQVYIYAPVEHKVILKTQKGVKTLLKGLRVDWAWENMNDIVLLDALKGLAFYVDKKGRVVKKVRSSLLQTTDRVYLDYKNRLYVYRDGSLERVWPDINKGPFGIVDPYKPVHWVIRLAKGKVVVLEFGMDSIAEPKKAIHTWYIPVDKDCASAKIIGFTRDKGIYILLEYLDPNAKVVKVQRRVLLFDRDNGRVLWQGTPEVPVYPVTKEFSVCGRGLCQLVLGPQGAKIIQLFKGL